MPGAKKKAMKRMRGGGMTKAKLPMKKMMRGGKVGMKKMMRGGKVRSK
jgi:hypothetical protein|tara:strand:- start:2783 stop:2926 length:144 start_codon:yes stop_codon:yes gene_type:complete